MLYSWLIILGQLFIHGYYFDENDFKPFKPITVEPWPSLHKQHENIKQNATHTSDNRKPNKNVMLNDSQKTTRTFKRKHNNAFARKHPANYKKNMLSALSNALKDASISVENHVHSQTLQPNKSKETSTRRSFNKNIKYKLQHNTKPRNLIDALKGANISIENHVQSQAINLNIRDKVGSSRRGSLDTLKGANISIENHVHSQTVKSKFHNKEHFARRGLLDALKGANISIENHVQSQAVNLNIRDKLGSSRRSLLDTLKGANISIENHVHSQTIKSKFHNKKHFARRGLLDTLKRANTSIENHVQSQTVKSKVHNKEHSTRRGLLDTLKGANISIENHVHSQTVKSKVHNRKSFARTIQHASEASYIEHNLKPERTVDVTGSKRDETYDDDDNNDNGVHLHGSNPLDVAAEIESNDKNLIPMLTRAERRGFKDDINDDRDEQNDEGEREEEPEYTVSDKGDFPAENDPYYSGRRNEDHHQQQSSDHEKKRQHKSDTGESSSNNHHNAYDDHNSGLMHTGTPNLAEMGFPANSYIHGDLDDYMKHSGHEYMGQHMNHRDHEHHSQIAGFGDERGGNNQQFKSRRVENKHMNDDDDNGPNHHGNEREEHYHHGHDREDRYNLGDEHEGSHHQEDRINHDREGNGYHEDGRLNEDERGGFHQQQHNHHGQHDDRDGGGSSEEGHHGREFENREDDQNYHGHNNDNGKGDSERRHHDREEHGDHEKQNYNLSPDADHDDRVSVGMAGHPGFELGNKNLDDNEVFGAIHGGRCITKKDGICYPRGGHDEDHHGHNDDHHESTADRMLEYQRNPFDPHDVNINHHHDDDEHHHEAVAAPIPQSVLQIGIDPTNHLHYVTQDEHHDLHYDNSLLHSDSHHEGQYEGHHDGVAYHHDPHDDYEGQYAAHAVRIDPHDNPHKHEKHELDHSIHDHIHETSDLGNTGWGHGGHDEHEHTGDGHEHTGWGHEDEHDGGHDGGYHEEHEGGHDGGHDGGHAEGHDGGHEGGEHSDHEDSLSYEHSHTYPAAAHQASYVPLFTAPQRELPMFQVDHMHSSDHYHNEHSPGQRRTNTLNTGQKFDLGNRDYASYMNQHLGDYLKEANTEYNVLGLEQMASKRKLEKDAQIVLNETEILKQLHDNTSDITILENENNSSSLYNTLNKTDTINNSHTVANNSHNVLPDRFAAVNSLDKTIASFLADTEIKTLLVESDKNSESGVRRKTIPARKQISKLSTPSGVL